MSVIDLGGTLPDRIHMIEIPMPNNPLRALCSYIIQGLPGERSLMIDTGFNEPEAYQSVLEDLNILGIDRNDLDLLTTHLHSDHCGQLLSLKSSQSQLFASPTDADLINQMTSESYWTEFSGFFTLLGLDADQITYQEHPGYTYCPKETLEFTTLEEGETLSYGGYTLEVLAVPGHTPGHIALAIPSHKLLFCGDHILPKITPNIAFWGLGYSDILGTFFESLQKIKGLDFKIGCAAHRGLIHDVNGRIDSLLDHHKDRLNDILSIVNQQPQEALTARQVAAQMHWDLTIKDYELFPKPQKWFAAAEAMSHLMHLAATGQIAMLPLDDTATSVAYFKAN